MFFPIIFIYTILFFSLQKAHIREGRCTHMTAHRTPQMVAVLLAILISLTMVVGGIIFAQTGHAKATQCGGTYVYGYNIINSSNINPNETVAYENLSREQKQVFYQLVENGERGEWPHERTEYRNRRLHNRIKYNETYYNLKGETSDCDLTDKFMLSVGIMLAVLGTLGILLIGWWLRRGWKEAQSA